MYNRIILRGGRLFVRHAYKVLGDCEFVLKPAKPVESTAEEQDELICDACAALNRQTLAARGTCMWVLMALPLLRKCDCHAPLRP